MDVVAAVEIFFLLLPLPPLPAPYCMVCVGFRVELSESMGRQMSLLGTKLQWSVPLHSVYPPLKECSVAAREEPANERCWSPKWLVNLHYI